MNFLLISYGDFDYDGRLRELYKVFSQAGTLYAITRGSTPKDDRHKLYRGGYAGFIKEAVAYGKRLKDIDVLVLDNRKSILPGLVLKAILKPRVMIQDCRELYIRKEVSHLAGKVGCIVEKRGIKQADILLCANQHRAELMKTMFRLEHEPIVYENLRRLEYSDATAPQEQEKKFSQYLYDGEIRIVSSSGCSVSRTNDVLVRNLDQVKHPCRLFLIGSNTDEDKRAIDEIVTQKGLNNVEILGQLNQDELKYLLSVCHIGIVNYHQKDTNNKYCASGKVYEFVYEGLPVVTTTNPPLKHMCDEAQIGVADDAYCNGIDQVITNYEQYRKNVAHYAEQHPVETNNDLLLARITERIEQVMAKQ